MAHNHMIMWARAEIARCAHIEKHGGAQTQLPKCKVAQKAQLGTNSIFSQSCYGITLN